MIWLYKEGIISDHLNGVLNVNNKFSFLSNVIKDYLQLLFLAENQIEKGKFLIKAGAIRRVINLISFHFIVLWFFVDKV